MTIESVLKKLFQARNSLCPPFEVLQQYSDRMYIGETDKAHVEQCSNCKIAINTIGKTLFEDIQTSLDPHSEIEMKLLTLKKAEDLSEIETEALFSYIMFHQNEIALDLVAFGISDINQVASAKTRMLIIKDYKNKLLELNP